MAGNLPDDVTHGDIDREFGGKEEPIGIEVTIGVAVEHEDGVDPAEQIMDCIEEAVSMSDLHIYESSVEVSEIAEGDVRGSVTVGFTIETVNQHEAESIGRKKLERKISEDPSWDLQVLDTTCVR